jgi:branched-chain amino acid transport system ATP-binding protein
MSLELRGVSTGYGTGPVLHDIALAVRPGEIVTLIGANGAGKSTLAKTISGLLEPLSGVILWDDQPIHSLPTAERLRRGIAHVPEGRQLFSGMKVSDNLTLGAAVRSGGKPDPAAEAEALRLFPVIAQRLGDVSGNFSGGQQQMLAIARGLMSSPRLLILDEPSLGLSPKLVQEIFALIKGLRDRGMSILLAEQNARAALAIADRGAVIENGRIVLQGPASELLHAPDIAERYLGVGVATIADPHAVAEMASQLKACVWAEDAGRS